MGWGGVGVGVGAAEGNPNLARWGKHTPGYIHSPVIVKVHALLTQVEGVFSLSLSFAARARRSGNQTKQAAAERLWLHRVFVFDCSLEQGDPISPLG